MTAPPLDADRLGPDRPTPVRLMNEYSAAFPIWGPDGLDDESRWPELDAGLVIALKQFATLFNASYDAQTGTWPAGFDVDAYFRTGEALRERVAAALGPAYRVTFDRWESARTR